MNKIQTKIFNYGNKKESSWPSQFGTGEKGSFVYDKETGKVVPAYQYVSKDINAPHVIADEMAPLQHMHDRKWYTSKHEFRRATVRAGYEEIGNDIDFHMKPKGTVDPTYDKKMEEAVARSYYEVRDGMAPLTELDKERCKIINRNLREYNYDRREYDRDGKLRG